MCAGHNLLPRSRHFKLPGYAMGDAQYHGGYADVLNLECGGREVATKASRTRRGLSSEVMRSFCKEVITWKALRHPNVLPLLGVVISEKKFAMVSEWMTNGNTKEFVAARQDVNRLELLVDVAKGLMYMHSQGMVHGDLKGVFVRGPKSHFLASPLCKGKYPRR